MSMKVTTAPDVAMIRVFARRGTEAVGIVKND